MIGKVSVAINQIGEELPVLKLLLVIIQGPANPISTVLLVIPIEGDYGEAEILLLRNRQSGL